VLLNAITKIRTDQYRETQFCSFRLRSTRHTYQISAKATHNRHISKQ